MEVNIGKFSAFLSLCRNPSRNDLDKKCKNKKHLFLIEPCTFQCKNLNMLQFVLTCYIPGVELKSLLNTHVKMGAAANQKTFTDYFETVFESLEFACLNMYLNCQYLNVWPSCEFLKICGQISPRGFIPLISDF